MNGKNAERLASILQQQCGPRFLVLSGKASYRSSLRQTMVERLSPEVVDRHFVFNCPNGVEREVLAASEVILGDPPAASIVLKHANKLKWFQSSWAGVDAIFAQEKKNFSLTRVSGKFGPQMAEYVMGWILFLERRIGECKRVQEFANWDDDTTASRRQLSEMSLLVLGAGDIGSHVASVAKSFGVRTVGFKKDISDPVNGFDSLNSDLVSSLQACDVIVNVLPATVATDQLLSGDILSWCARRPVFINVGRGNVISEDSILAALEKEWISEAVLDVFPCEPLPVESPLWRHEHVHVTPHIAAKSTVGDVVDVFFENLVRYLEGRELLYRVSWEKGY